MATETTQPSHQQGSQPAGKGNAQFPQVYFNVKWDVPPRVVQDQAEADALDPTEWTTIPPQPAQQPAQPAYPKLFYNVNVPPEVIGSEAEEKALSSEYKQFPIPDDLAKAAQAANAQAAAAAKAKAASQPAPPAGSQGAGGQHDPSQQQNQQTGEHQHHGIFGKKG